MSNLIHQRRLHQLRQLLLNLIYGYYNYRIPVVSTQTYLETLVRLANTLADTLDKKTSHTQNLIKGVILLSMDGTIISINHSMASAIGVKMEMLHGTPLSGFLTNEDQRLWENFHHSSSPPNAFYNSLTFITQEGLLMKYTCTIESMLLPDYGEVYLLSCFSGFKNPNEPTSIASDISPTTKFTSNPADIYYYILSLGDEPIPCVKELVSRADTNSHTILSNFKKQYNISLHNWINELRLLKSHGMIKETELPIKAIAITLGFKSYPYFSRIFKERFGHSPQELRRNSH